MVSGVGLANRLIAGMYAGLRRQNVWNGQYDYGAPNWRGEAVRDHA
jgi:hypothetical protein